MGWLPWLGAEPELALPLPVVLALILLMIEDMVYVYVRDRAQVCGAGYLKYRCGECMIIWGMALIWLSRSCRAASEDDERMEPGGVAVDARGALS